MAVVILGSLNTLGHSPNARLVVMMTRARPARPRQSWTARVPALPIRASSSSRFTDKGRRNGVFVALNGITGDERNLTAAFFHVAAAMIEGVQVLVLTGEELASMDRAEDLIPLFKRKLLGMTRQQIRAAKGVDDDRAP